MEQNLQKSFFNIVINILIPFLVLTKLKLDFDPKLILLIALSFPLIYGIYDFINEKKLNMFSAFGFINVLLTGGIGLMELSVQWLAIKEASIPLLIGLFIMIAKQRDRCMAMKFLGQVINFKKVREIVTSTNQESLLKKRLNQTTNIFALSFLVSGFLNYCLAKFIVTSPPGTNYFNEEVGRLTALSYPVIVLPSMIVMSFSLWFIFHHLKKMTKLSIEELLLDQAVKK